MLPYAALVFCVEHWQSPQELVELESPPSEPSLPYEARLQSLPRDQAGICPGGGASPTAAINIINKTPLNKIVQDQTISACSQALRLNKGLLISLDKTRISRGAHFPINKTSSVPVPSPVNKLIIQTQSSPWTFFGRHWKGKFQSFTFFQIFYISKNAGWKNCKRLHWFKIQLS